MIRLAGGAAAIGGAYFLLAFLFHSGTVRTIHRREDLLHPPGSRRREGVAAPQRPAEKPTGGL